MGNGCCRLPYHAHPILTHAPYPAFCLDLEQLALVGDVHGCWLHDAERAALQLLRPQLCVLVGDFGDGDEEGAALVQQVGGTGGQAACAAPLCTADSLNCVIAFTCPYRVFCNDLCQPALVCLVV